MLRRVEPEGFCGSPRIPLARQEHMHKESSLRRRQEGHGHRREVRRRQRRERRWCPLLPFVHTKHAQSPSICTCISLTSFRLLTLVLPNDVMHIRVIRALCSALPPPPPFPHIPASPASPRRRLLVLMHRRTGLGVLGRPRWTGRQASSRTRRPCARHVQAHGRQDAQGRRL